MDEDFIRPAKDGVYVKLRVSPGAKNTQVKGLYGEQALKLCVAAPPVDGKANAEIEHFLSSLLGVSRSEVCVVRGASGWDKLVFVWDTGVGDVRESLTDLVG